MEEQFDLTENEIKLIIEEQYNLIRNKTILIINEFNKKLIEREEVIPLLILGLYSRQNILLFGEAGISKTRMMLLLASLTGYKDYNINIAEISKPEQMIGTVNDLNNNEARSIVNCQIALIDEIFKAMENGILHSLLNIIREKMITLEGIVKKLDLKMVIGASNEFGTHKSLIPFNDRFPLKIIVERIKNQDNFLKYWNEEFDKDLKFDIKITDVEIDSILKLSKRIKEEELVRVFILQFRQAILKDNLHFSDRAFGDSKIVLKIAAILNGRDTIDISDVFLFNYMGWIEETGKKRLNIIINEIVFGNKSELQTIIMDFNKNLQKIDDLIQGKIEQTLNYQYEIHSNDTFNSISKELENILSKYLTAFSQISNFRNRRKINHSFELKIKRNVLIKNYKDTVFDVEILLFIRDKEKYLKNQILILQNWFKNNKTSTIYLQNIKNLQKN
jgi:MoxR-like ATPase